MSRPCEQREREGFSPATIPGGREIAIRGWELPGRCNRTYRTQKSHRSYCSGSISAGGVVLAATSRFVRGAAVALVPALGHADAAELLLRQAIAAVPRRGVALHNRV